VFCVVQCETLGSVCVECSADLGTWAVCVLFVVLFEIFGGICVV